MEHQDYMEQALVLAREAADCGEVPVGCVIVKDGRIVGRAATGERRSRPCTPTRRWRPWRRPTQLLARGGWRAATSM